MSIAETVRSCLSGQHVDFELVPHPRTGSSRESAQAAHVDEAHIAKAVIIRDAGSYAMVVIPASHWIRLSAIHEETGRDYVLAYEADVDGLFTDCQPGAIPPLGPAYGLETFLDQRLTMLANVYFEAGDHEQLVRVGGAAFLEMLRGARHGYFSHDN